eukprot:TRINITY_DN13377_c0_g1_i1.p1 TRINITY_DN13377_c0_g1~~TRINITY_DN13377_c0_g1_i1.p1  ORF type:complete len:146 (-),score=20.64 TRINITY_DN13377_c0_g1_i1:33-470(-)
MHTIVIHSSYLLRGRVSSRYRYIILLAGVDDLDEVGLEGGSSDKESVDVTALVQVDGVAGGDGSTIEDAGSGSDLLGDVVAEPLTDDGVDLLGLLGSGDLSGSDAVSYTHLRAHETPEHLVCRLLLEKKKKKHLNTNVIRKELYK